MENKNIFKVFHTSESEHDKQQSPQEAKVNFQRQYDFDWKYLLAKIYQNINGPVLRKRKSTRQLIQEENNSPSDSNGLKCHCKKTKCLKLYCQCFAKGQYCSGCNCQSCNNSSQYDLIRSSIIDEMIQKNPNTFDVVQRSKNISCICKKTGCLKKYCECFNIGKKCGQECKCANCENNQ